MLGANGPSLQVFTMPNPYRQWSPLMMITGTGLDLIHHLSSQAGSKALLLTLEPLDTFGSSTMIRASTPNWLAAKPTAPSSKAVASKASVKTLRSGLLKALSGTLGPSKPSTLLF